MEGSTSENWRGHGVRVGVLVGGGGGGGVLVAGGGPLVLVAGGGCVEVAGGCVVEVAAGCVRVAVAASWVTVLVAGGEVGPTVLVAHACAGW